MKASFGEKTPFMDNNLLQPNGSIQGIQIPQDYSNPARYVQIGCEYYYHAMTPDAQGHRLPTLIPWRYTQIKRDFLANPEDIKRIPRYLGLCSYPSHIDYRQEFDGYFNTYSQLHWMPAPGDWGNIKMMIKHIFGDQYSLGLDYIHQLYVRPMQMLPILILVSRDRSTGKTTFLNLLKEIFGANMAFVTNDTLRSKFNSERASRLIIACDEAFQNKKEDSERLKALSTARKTYIEFKGKDRFEIDNYAKLILCSNNINDPVYIDREEVRYWVREIEKPQSDNPMIMEAMKKEIPAFLYFLLNRDMSVPRALSRMWFSPEQLRTPALDRIIRKCRPSSELDLAEVLLDQMDLYGTTTLEFTNTDLKALLKSLGHEIPDAHRIICKQWDIPKASNKMAYDLYAPWVERPPQRVYGRYYRFERSYLESLVPRNDIQGVKSME